MATIRSSETTLICIYVYDYTYTYTYKYDSKSSSHSNNSNDSNTSREPPLVGGDHPVVGVVVILVIMIVVVIVIMMMIVNITVILIVIIVTLVTLVIIVMIVLVVIIESQTSSGRWRPSGRRRQPKLQLRHLVFNFKIDVVDLLEIQYIEISDSSREHLRTSEPPRQSY